MILLTALLFAAQPEAASCTAPAPLAAPWTGWRLGSEIKAGVGAAGAPALILGKPVEAMLVPVAQAAFVTPPVKGDAEGYAGLFALTLKKAARIGIGLSGPAWIDVIDGKAALTSVDHGHGPECSGIRKIVWFDLSAGRNIVQIAGAQSQTIKVMAAAKP